MTLVGNSCRDARTPMMLLRQCATIVGTRTRRFARDCACASAIVITIFTRPALSNCVQCANREFEQSQQRNQKMRINTPVIMSASIQIKSMLNHARRSIATPSFS